MIGGEQKEESVELHQTTDITIDEIKAIAKYGFGNDNNVALIIAKGGAIPDDGNQQINTMNLTNLDSPQFDVTTLEKPVIGNLLMFFNEKFNFHLNPSKLMRFAITLESTYQSPETAPYHNVYHAGDVAITILRMMDQSSYVKQLSSSRTPN